MKKNIKKIIATAGFLLLIGFLPGHSFAQIGGGGSEGADSAGADEEVPIDGGISLLIAAGVGYGAKKMHDARKKKAGEQNSDDTIQL